MLLVQAEFKPEAMGLVKEDARLIQHLIFGEISGGSDSEEVTELSGLLKKLRTFVTTTWPALDVDCRVTRSPGYVEAWNDELKTNVIDGLNLQVLVQPSAYGEYLNSLGAGRTKRLQ